MEKEVVQWMPVNHWLVAIYSHGCSSSITIVFIHMLTGTYIVGLGDSTIVIHCRDS